MNAVQVAESPAATFKVGQLVEVRSADEIFATLDERGTLDSLPFMPEMMGYCGMRLRVGKVANKVCDTMTRSGMRRMDDAVHLLDVRCDGSGHGGCEAACLIYWKTAWLRPVDESASGTGSAAAAGASGRLLPLLVLNSTRPAQDGSLAYVCQPTEILNAAPRPLPWRDLGQYVQDVRVGNATVWFSLRAFLVGLFNRAQHVSQRALPRRLWFRDGLPWGFLKGTQVKTPTADTGLKAGDLVRIRSKEEIMATLNAELLNRGMGFDAEMARFCGRTARVARRVNRIIDEKTGQMIDMKNPCIVLDGIICEGAYNASCPRSIPAYWREVWLDKITEPA